MDPNPYSTLSFKGVTSLSDTDVEAISNFRGSTVYLESLTHLSEVEAEALVNIRDGVFLNGLTRLSDPTAEVLSNFKGRRLYFNRLTCLSDTAAKALSKTNGTLDLPGLTTLGSEVAEALSNYKGRLNLNGLTSLNDAEAKALSDFKGGALYLHGLTSLSDAAAEALSNCMGELCLNGLTSLNKATAKALSNFTGALYLNGLTSLDDASIELLSNFKGSKLYINRLTSLSDTAAESLSSFKGRMLSLNGLTNLSDAAAKTALKLRGRISCGSINPIDFYLSILGASASIHFDLKIDPKDRRYYQPQHTLKIENLTNHVFCKIFPSVISSYEKETLDFTHKKGVDKNELFGICSALYSMYLIQIFPSQLNKQVKFENSLESSVVNNIEKSGVSSEFYYMRMAELFDYVEGGRHGLWNTATLLFISNSLCPSAPLDSNPAISLAVRIRTFIEVASRNLNLTFDPSVG